MGTIYSARVGETVDARFRCASCGLAKWARLRTTGAGSSHSSSYFHDDDARDRAIDEAAKDALDVGSAALAYVPCPRCGKRNAEKDQLSPTLVLLPWVMVGGAIGGVAGQGALPGIGGGALLGALIALGRLWMRGVRAKRSAVDVKFFEWEPPDHPFVGKRCAICDRSIVTAKLGHRCQACGAPVHHGECGRTHASSHGAGPNGHEAS